MYMLTAHRKRVELELLQASWIPTADLSVVEVASETASPFVTHAARAFFDMDRRAGTVRARGARAGPSPTVFRERQSGLLRTVHREAVIRFKPDISERRRKSILDKHGFKVRGGNRFVPGQLIVYQPADNRTGAHILEAANDWAGMEEVIFATPNFVSQYRRAALPKIHAAQWHLFNAGALRGQVTGEDVDAKEAWKVTTGSRRITVAVLDDGVDVEHPNLRANVKQVRDADEPRDRVGRDFFVPDDHPEHFNPRPKKFRFPFDQMEGNDIHGTPCAGVIAAVGRDGGAIGIAPRCRVLAVKIFHADDLASDARVADAIRYAALHADVLSCSWSGGQSPDIELAIEDARALGRGGRGAAVFCAAGNEDGSPVGFPAALPSAVAVGASTDHARRASYSNVGPELWVVAPSSGGVRGIFTTDVAIAGRGFNIGRAAAGGADGLHTNDFGGTSSATPLAAGTAALMLSAKPKLDSAAIKEIIAKTADKIGSGYDARGHSKKFGFGRVNAAKAVQEAVAHD